MQAALMWTINNFQLMECFLVGAHMVYLHALVVWVKVRHFT